MQVDTRNPEVSEALKDWFAKRDELMTARMGNAYLNHENDQDVFALLEEAVDIADDLVAFLCPTKADRIQHTGESA